MTQPLAEPRVVAVALHDGWYGAATGAGRSNHALLRILAQAVAPGVELVILPVRLSPECDGHEPTWQQAARDQLSGVPYRVVPLENGSDGRARWGGLPRFRELAGHTASVVSELGSRHPRGVLIAVDRCFAGLGPMLPASMPWQLLYLPRSTALHHPDPDERAWELAGLEGWIRRNAHIGAISTHMGDLLTRSGVPSPQLLDVPDGLTPADHVPLSAAPPLPAAAEHGFLFAMGRAQPSKGWDDLLDAVVLLRDRGVGLPHLLMASVTDNPPSDYQRHLAARITELRLDMTLWTRFDHGLPGLLHHPAARGVIVPSRVEALGRIPLEAHATGAAPVITTTAGGLTDTVTDNITGITCRPHDPASLADAIHRAVNSPPTDLDRFRANGARLCAARDYTTTITDVLRTAAPWAAAPPAPPTAEPGAATHSASPSSP